MAVPARHVVHEARDVDQQKAASIRASLERRFPAQTCGFVFKLTPLSVGAWLLVIRGKGAEASEVLECGCTYVQISHVLRCAEHLATRWRRKTEPDWHGLHD